MTRIAALLLTAVLVVGSVSALPAAASAATTTLPSSSTALQTDTNATNVTPGQRLAGIVGAGQAEFEGEITSRAYGLQYASASSNASKAQVVQERLTDVRDRLQTLEQRKAVLDEARANGSMSEGEYRARMTALAARGQQLEQLVNESEDRARGLPEDVLASKGLNVTAIRTLQAQAANLTGPEVAEIARSVAGPEVGQSVGGPSGDLGGPPADDPNDRENADAAAAISEAELAVVNAQARLAQADRQIGPDASQNATDALDQAEAELQRARQALDRARTLQSEGNHQQALERAEAAIDHAEAAQAHANAAIAAASDQGTDQPGGDA
jgi:uncharacterized protein (DUF2164 family)